jgi:hypothetical protein
MPAKMTGIAEMKARLAQVKTSLHAQLRTAVEAEATRLLEEAKARTPVEMTKHAKEPGELRDSGTVTMVETGTTVKAVISFGTEYAVYQHEDLALHHENGQAKFLESVLNEEVGNVAGNLAKGIDLAKT